MESPHNFRFAIDRGGTFTDIYASWDGVSKTHPQGYFVTKLLSQDTSVEGYDAPREGICCVLEQVAQVTVNHACVDTSLISSIRMGTTVATNALLERKGTPTVLVITRGFRDILQIGNQSRPHIFDLRIRKPELLYVNVVEATERVRIGRKDDVTAASTTFIRGRSGEDVFVATPLDTESLRRDLQHVYDSGIRSVAVMLLHSYAYSDHEVEVGKIASSIGFTQVSLSSELMPMVRAVPRGLTACVDAYLTPSIRAYLEGFTGGFDKGLSKVHLEFMQSDGGLSPPGAFHGFRAVLSGPAGGVVGYATTAYQGQPLVGFDMGGTSTDVSRYDGALEHVFETETAGVTIQAPQLDISTVAAGGGSRLFFRDGLFVVGPESSGADPGPLCYRRGGYLSVTDANLFLGRIVVDQFPNIFGPDRNQALDSQASAQAFQELAKDINMYARLHWDPPVIMSPEEVALGFIHVANESMARPIRNLTVGKGHDIKTHALACFGGAGGQHACAVARALGMGTVHVHQFSGILSAYGIALADTVVEVQEPSSVTVNDVKEWTPRLDMLGQQAQEKLEAQGFDAEHITLERYLNLRYQGTDTSMMVKKNLDATYEQAFVAQYEREYGFTLTGREVVVDDVRVRGIGAAQIQVHPTAAVPCEQSSSTTTTKIYFEGGWQQSQVIPASAVDVVKGPTIIVDNTSTILVEPGCTIERTKEGNLLMRVSATQSVDLSSGAVDAVYLSIFAHRFMSIAEQMGRTLQRTSISTNIKERLDYSCALFDQYGGLVANAPHLPVHLGAMQEAVKWQVKHLGDSWKDGDIVLTNHPSAGGSHLPDMTVITPVFEGGKPAFFLASRAHHADIGGITPGSMPPFSHFLSEEGCAIKSFKLVKQGVFQEQSISQLLCAEGSDAIGTRNLKDNLSDLGAQVAANNKGIGLVKQLIGQYGLKAVQAYMKHVQNNAEQAVRSMLRSIAKEHGVELNALEHMDDGSPIQVKISIDPEQGAAVFDFEGTGHEVFGNTNAPEAITKSAIIYCLRSLVEQDIPLNQGCMAPIQVCIPHGSLLSPSETAAVVGGNVLTSQRVTDVILTAFEAAACSQGCMNNFVFGDASFGYYETICGGAGAGRDWHGTSGVHTHMTNTRITDVEVMERRYPVLLHRFSLRKNSGGKGKFVGGDGVVREVEFLKDMTAGILSERRVFAPPGLCGGQPGERGLNLLVSKEGTIKNLGGKATVDVCGGDRIRILSPGGGGYGST